VNAETQVQVTRVLRAQIQDVFAAWTDPKLMSRWFFPVETWTASVECNLVVGGRYTVTMHMENDETTVLTGVYQEIAPPNRLAFTWSSHAILNTLVTVVLRDLGGSTELTLTHERLVEAGARELTSSGWTGCLASLERYLAAV
jgi:uncharacterized protein YndB with AHSA1/START domain